MFEVFINIYKLFLILSYFKKYFTKFNCSIIKSGGFVKQRCKI